MMNGREEKTFKLGKTILTESELKIAVTYKGEIFTMLYPTPLQKTMIENDIALRLNGYSRSSFSPDHLAYVEACVTIAATMIRDECPDWFEGPWDCYDDELITALFAGYFQFRDEFRRRIRGDSVAGDSK
jgi:hypothetical protein